MERNKIVATPPANNDGSQNQNYDLDDTLCTPIANIPIKTSRRSVEFGKVRVRNHERVLNRRASSCYASLDIGWAYGGISDHFDIDEFEDIKKETQDKEQEVAKKRESFEGPIKKPKDHERLAVLTKYGYSPREVLKMERVKQTDRNARFFSSTAA